ncbi:MAG: single-stranded DNA-binding protein [Bacilli bacterium]
MNKVFLIGRLTKDPEMRLTPGTGNSVTNFSLAVDRNYVSQNGQREADFINIVCWRKLAEHVANNLSKGRLIAVAGSIQTRKYQNGDGSNRYITEILAEEVKFLDYAKGNQGKENGEELFKGEDEELFPTNDLEIPF